MKKFKYTIKLNTCNKLNLLMNRPGILRKLVILLFIIVSSIFMVDFIRFPECYCTTWKYQLKNDIGAGKPAAVEYYQTNYIDKGKILFGGEGHE